MFCLVSLPVLGLHSGGDTNEGLLQRRKDVVDKAHSADPSLRVPAQTKQLPNVGLAK
jgi:hypothetical protein